MSQKLGEANVLGYSFNIQDGADISNMKEKRVYKKYEKYNQKGFDLEC